MLSASAGKQCQEGLATIGYLRELLRCARYYGNLAPLATAYSRHSRGSTQRTHILGEFLRVSDRALPS